MLPVAASYNKQWRGYIRNVQRELPIVRLERRERLEQG